LTGDYINNAHGKATTTASTRRVGGGSAAATTKNHHQHLVDVRWNYHR
jgi:hypothetical protein